MMSVFSSSVCDYSSQRPSGEKERPFAVDFVPDSFKRPDLVDRSREAVAAEKFQLKTQVRRELASAR